MNDIILGSALRACVQTRDMDIMLRRELVFLVSFSLVIAMKIKSKWNLPWICAGERQGEQDGRPGNIIF